MRTFTVSRLHALRAAVSVHRSRSTALALVLLASVLVPVTSAAPAQAFVGGAGSTATSPSVTTAKQLASSTSKVASKASKRAVRSAVTAAKPAGAKKSVRKSLTSSKILATARKYDGSYYRHGGTTPAGFDCSGYTRYVFGKLGRSLPHNSSAQYGVVKHVSRSNARAGDLIFFRSASGSIYHVGIYAGSGKLYHASQQGVRTGLGKIFSSRVSFGRV